MIVVLGGDPLDQDLLHVRVCCFWSSAVHLLAQALGGFPCWPLGRSVCSSGCMGVVHGEWRVAHWRQVLQRESEFIF